MFLTGAAVSFKMVLIKLYKNEYAELKGKNTV